MPHFVEVILPLSLAKTFTYKVTEAEFGYIQKGMRIAVPFGRNKIYTALALELHQKEPDLYQARDIHQILDEKPLVNAFQMAHWLWIASYYMCAIGDVYRSAMPSALLLESETVLLSSGEEIETANLDDEEFLIYEALQQSSALKIEEVSALLNKKTILPVIQRLMTKGVLSLQEHIRENYKPKLLRYVRLQEEFGNPDNLNELLQILQNAPKQKELVLAYFQIKASYKKPITAKALCEHAGSSNATLKALVDKGVFEEYLLQHDRVQFEDDGVEKQLVLSPAQQEAFEALAASFETKEVSLLHGVTASGKTEIYIKLIEDFLEQDKQVLYLLPEIALTAQLVMRLTAYFGNKVAVYHSKYSQNERVEVWQHLNNGSEKAQVVIGARSALFLPFSNLGLVIVDEEHEQTFKQQDPAPRYHARDAAIVLASAQRAKVVLGSATPSLETYYNAQSGKYGLVTLQERFGNVPLPEIVLVDLKDKHFRKRMTRHFSDTLIEEMTETFARGQQVILFQNRRGYAPVVECMSCGHVPQCRQCDVSLTYHKNKSQLRCHYCGYTIANPTNCHSCSGRDLTTKGFGTEQIQQELLDLFPKARTARMDQDTTRAKFSFERIIEQFANREVDILVGTQMLAKGLDFDNVGLVGIMNADNMLYHPDFRAFERSYQLMTQVAGRSGRSKERGKVIIQTYNPNHNTIQQVTRNDYLGMYEEQLYERRNFKYPPYFRLVRLTLKQRDYEKLRESSMWLYQFLCAQLGDIPVLGPEEPAISRIRNEYIRTIMIKIPADRPLQGTKKTIRKILDSFENVPQFRAVKVAVNVDFY